MNAMYAIYKDSYGEIDGEEAFVVVTDGVKTEILFPLGVSPESIEDMQVAIGSRVSRANTEDPEELLTSITYNMPLDVSITEPFDTYEDAMKMAQEFMQVVNDFDQETTEAYAPITPDAMKED